MDEPKARREPLVISGRFYTAEEAADELGVSKQRTLVFLREGRLTGVRMGNHWLIAACSVERFIRLRAMGNSAGDVVREVPGEYTAAAAAEVNNQ